MARMQSRVYAVCSWAAYGSAAPAQDGPIIVKRISRNSGAIALLLAAPVTLVCASRDAVATDRSAPRVISVALDPPAIVGRSAELRVVARAPEAPVSGMVVRFGDGDSFGLSACRAGIPRPTPTKGPFAPGRTVRLAVPHVFRVAGPRPALVRLAAGDCSKETQTASQRLTVTATRPGERPVAPTTLGVPLPGSRLPPLSGAGPLLPLNVLAALAQPARRALGCSGASRRVGRSARALREARRSLLCLLNAQRRVHGLRALRANGRLLRAATGHSNSMVHRRYFSHVQPGGVDLLSRLRRTGYLAGARVFLAGENLGFGRGRASAPAGMVRSWMRSTPHRLTMLSGRFTDVGLGVVRGIPGRPNARGATYTVDFGVRRR